MFRNGLGTYCERHCAMKVSDRASIKILVITCIITFARRNHWESHACPTDHRPLPVILTYNLP